jgi:hypothetical protein
VNKNDLLTPVDLIGKNVPPVHPPIPNKWWIETRIDPGFGDSPQRDADEDGFSNEDEYTAETDPNDIRDYPSLITKLSYVGDEFVKWVLKPGYPSAGGDFGFKYGDSLGRAERTSAAVPVMPGGLFFDDGPIKGRFKLISSEVRPVKNENFNSVVDTTFVIIEDQKPNKLGDKYEIPAQFRNSDADKYSKFDRTAILSLEALGLDGQEIKVEEFTSFALPPTSETKAYKLTEVTPDKITVERTAKDGKTETYVISKGSTGPDAP